jgi:uncharacterized membrane protein
MLLRVSRDPVDHPLGTSLEAAETGREGLTMNGMMDGMMGCMQGWGLLVVLLVAAILVALVVLILRGRGR